MKIAITGSIGSGKSSMGDYLREQEKIVFDTDKMVHDLYRNNKQIYNAVIDLFGEEILDPDQSINRSKLGQIVFNSSDAIQKLEKIVYPEITKIIKSYDENDTVVFYEVPMLFEAQMAYLFDYVVMVDTDDEIALNRLSQYRPNIKDAKERLCLQMDRSLKRKQSNYVILNNGNLDSFHHQIDDWLKNINSEVTHDSI